MFSLTLIESFDHSFARLVSLKHLSPDRTLLASPNQLAIDTDDGRQL
jgi:hypothetical protein